VKHHIGVELRLQSYEKVQRFSLSVQHPAYSGDLLTLGLLHLGGAQQFFSTGLAYLVPLTV